MEEAANTADPQQQPPPPPPAKRLSPTWQVLNFERWVQAVLILNLTDPGDRVLELYSSNGANLGHWKRAGVASYTSFEPSLDTLMKSKTRWELKKPFPANFVQHHPLDARPYTQLVPENECYDLVACFVGLEEIFVAPNTASCFFGNVSSVLKEGGFFFGVLPDSSAIWNKVQKQAKNDSSTKAKGSLFSISFDSEISNTNFFGIHYKLQVSGSPDQHHYLVHFPTLLALADQHGLEMIEISNYLDIYEDQRYNWASLLKGMAVYDKKNNSILPTQLELIGLKTNFVFKKK